MTQRDRDYIGDVTTRGEYCPYEKEDEDKVVGYIPVVLAGNYEQFLYWCKETKTNPRKAIYLSEMHRIYGLQNFKIIKYGTWLDNPVYTPRFLDELAIRVKINKRRIAND